jgi:hypothetical protein
MSTVHTHNMQELYLLDSQGLNLDKDALLAYSLNNIMTLWGAKPTKQPNKHAHIRIVFWTFLYFSSMSPSRSRDKNERLYGSLAVCSRRFYSRHFTAIIFSQLLFCQTHQHTCTHHPHTSFHLPPIKHLPVVNLQYSCLFNSYQLSLQRTHLLVCICRKQSKYLYIFPLNQ